MMKRTDRAALAQDTLHICETGRYTTADGVAVDVRDAIDAAVAGSRLVRPGDVRALRAQADAARGPRRAMVIAATPESTLTAAERLCASSSATVGVLNFASAKNAGGGFLGGSQAQEESLARSSALYPTLMAHPDYYDANRHERSALYTDHAIVSPGVPVFRRDDGALLAAPYVVTFLTAPAVNAGVVRQRGGADVDRIEETMRRRIGQVLDLAVVWGCRRLVLGAWGCGVFQNDPKLIAGLFAEALGGSWDGVFDEVVFAVYDQTRTGDVYRNFAETFG